MCADRGEQVAARHRTAQLQPTFSGLVVESCTLNRFIGWPQSLPEPVLDDETREAFDIAYNNIKLFHEAQLLPPLEVETMPGVRCRRVTRPIGAVGVYVPGGTAVLPSSALMLSVPAGIAGCQTIVLATPPRPDGSITPEVLYCAKKAGVTHVLKAGGAQAVAAMAWGTESCPKVRDALVMLPLSASSLGSSSRCSLLIVSTALSRWTRSWGLATSTSPRPRWCCKIARQ